jgi:hypothetical protein
MIYGTATSWETIATTAWVRRTLAIVAVSMPNPPLDSRKELFTRLRLSDWADVFARNTGMRVSEATL